MLALVYTNQKFDPIRQLKIRIIAGPKKRKAVFKLGFVYTRARQNRYGTISAPGFSFWRDRAVGLLGASKHSGQRRQSRTGRDNH